LSISSYECSILFPCFPQVTQASKYLSVIWKSMSSKERKKWEDMAKKDKERYKLEMSIYSGPSTLPKCHKRYKKDKSAPKRPMSAYLDYSKTLRSQVIRDNPHVIDNREISKMLGVMWKNATEKEKEPFINKEKILRAKYIHDVEKWRKARDERIKAHRAMREELVQHAIDNGTSDQLIQVADRCQISEAALQKSTMKSEMNSKLSSSIDFTDIHREKGFPTFCNQSPVNTDIPADNTTMFGYTLDNAPGMNVVYNQDPIILSVVPPYQHSVGVLRPLDHTQAYINQRYSHLSSYAVENLPGLHRNFRIMPPQADMQIDFYPNTYAFGSLLNRAQTSHGNYSSLPNESFCVGYEYLPL